MALMASLNPKVVQAVGSYTQILMGRADLSGGSATITLPPQFRIRVSAAWSNSSTNVAYASAETANTITITGTGSDTVTWLALVDSGI